MANDVKLASSTQITHVSSGGSIAAASFSGTADISGALSSTNLAKYPLAEVVLECALGGAVAAASNYVLLYRRDINVAGTADAVVPTSAAPAYSSRLVGLFSIPPYSASTTGVVAVVTDVPLREECEFYIENKTNATINAAWTLKVLPVTYNLT